jgi:hypothetical protein
MSSQNKTHQDQSPFQNHLSRQGESLTTASAVGIAECAEEMQKQSSFGAFEQQLLCRCGNQQMRECGSSGAPQTTARKSSSENIHNKKVQMNVAKMRCGSACKEKILTFKIWLQSFDAAKLREH